MGSERELICVLIQEFVRHNDANTLLGKPIELDSFLDVQVQANIFHRVV